MTTLTHSDIYWIYIFHLTISGASSPQALPGEKSSSGYPEQVIVPPEIHFLRLRACHKARIHWSCPVWAAEAERKGSGSTNLCLKWKSIYNWGDNFTLANSRLLKILITFNRLTCLFKCFNFKGNLLHDPNYWKSCPIWSQRCNNLMFDVRTCSLIVSFGIIA